MNDRPVGKRFTDVYRERGEPRPDSAKFRRRIAHKLNDIVDADVASYLRAETGYTLYGSSRTDWWQSFISELPLDDLLDFITTVIHGLMECRSEYLSDFYLFAKRAMDEENLNFELDEAGGVHYRIDTAFQDSRRAALSALEGPENAASKAAFEQAHQALTGHPPDSLTAVRMAFDAVENLFKIRFQVSRLGASEVKSKLRDIGAEFGTRAKDAANRFNESFAEWTNACHQYRHAPGQADPSPPPMPIAVALVDSAATYIRYLTSFPPAE